MPDHNGSASAGPSCPMSADALATYPVETARDGLAPMSRAQGRMVATGQWSPSQAMGRHWPIGCVALEITQRCNLDCTLCYLSESSEALHDLPVSEILRRIGEIRRTYGPDTNVQVTGGEPTLRRRDELIAIVEAIRREGLRATLMTNGIRARRELLSALADAGLCDVAFHVDITQERRGYDDEAALNALRLDYIERARDLGLTILFNTTVCARNLDDIPDVARFFVQHADHVHLASFQIQTETGRGTEPARPVHLGPERIVAAIQQGAGTRLDFDSLAVGHSKCTRYGVALVCNGRAQDALDDRRLVAAVSAAGTGLRLDRRNQIQAATRIAGWVMRHPREVPAAVRWLARKAWAMKADLLRGRMAVHKLSFLVHSFMDAKALDRQRLDACVFMAATANGHVPMCLHNARRDDFILPPVRLKADDGNTLWDPVSGCMRAGDDAAVGVVRHRRGTLKGRAARTDGCGEAAE